MGFFMGFIRIYDGIPSGELSHFANWKDPAFCLWENPLFNYGHFQLLCKRSPEGTVCELEHKHV